MQLHKMLAVPRKLGLSAQDGAMTLLSAVVFPRAFSKRLSIVAGETGVIARSMFTNSIVTDNPGAIEGRRARDDKIRVLKGGIISTPRPRARLI